MPKSPGVYFFQNKKGEIIYVGKAANLRSRVASYFSGNLLPKTAMLVSEIAKIDHIVVENEVDALLLEANQIRKLKPRYNIAGKDDKSFPLIEITREKIPLVRIVRRQENPKNIYFGPYPTGSNIVGLLGYLRKIFPYVSQRHKNGEVCLRSHLGLCPCPNYKDYKKNLKHLIDFLYGKRAGVSKNLTTQMQSAANVSDFEKAAEIKRKLDRIAYITSAKNPPWKYEQNPNLVDDRKAEEARSLAEMLGINSIWKIEAYDISNISGKFATGAGVAFVNGEPEKKFYRRYKVRSKNTPDDYQMLAEVLSRRLKSDVPLPDLFVIDGGKGQLNTTLQTLSCGRMKMFDKIKIIALAKKLEIIYTDDGKEIHLPENSPALHLLQRLRNEAHRFSRKYHIYLRSKKMLD